jgi:membrane-associated phospholipid phosphatase
LQTPAILAGVVKKLSLALLAFAATIGVIGFRFAGAHWSRGDRFDLSAVQDGLTQLAAPRARHATNLLLNTISIASLALGGTALAVVALLRRRPDLAAACVLLLVGAPVTAELLKQELRPRLNVPSGTRQSFPSGHSTIAMAIGLALVLVVPASLRVPAAAAGLAYAAAVGTALVVSGAHFPSDVAGGFCVATVWAALAALIAGRPSELRWPLRVFSGLMLLAAAVVILVLITHPGAIVRVRLHFRLVESAVGIAAVATVLYAAFIAAITARGARVS